MSSATVAGDLEPQLLALDLVRAESVGGDVDPDDLRVMLLGLGDGRRTGDGHPGDGRLVGELVVGVADLQVVDDPVALHARAQREAHGVDVRVREQRLPLGEGAVAVSAEAATGLGAREPALGGAGLAAGVPVVVAVALLADEHVVGVGGGAGVPVRVEDDLRARLRLGAVPGQRGAVGKTLEGQRPGSAMLSMTAVTARIRLGSTPASTSTP